ncbi:O-antigen ligase family protein [Vibrio diabolicus]|uniref:O-antigen ligase family protein n=1 Tax=Vibrio diabolicus TaxID=50719 RepID=UPI0015F3E091|nr:O-antigen ligase family protein [Vibrio diabolicus]
MGELYERKLEQLLFWLACGLLFIDSLTGFFVLKVGVDLKLSILYKLVFLFLGLLLLLQRNIKYFIISFSLLSYVIGWSIAQNWFGSIKYLVFDFGEALKLVSTIIVFLVFSTFKLLDCRKLHFKIFSISVTVLFINIFFSLIGIGSKSYGVFGAKGFFYAANALSGIIVLIAAFVLVRAFKHGIVMYVGTTGFFALLAAMIGTKSGILGVMIVASLIPLSRFIVTPKLLGALAILVPVAVIGAFYIYDLFINSLIYERIVYFYETGGVTRALLSDRDVFFWDIFPTFVNQGYGRLLWGFGFEQLNLFNKDTVEMDPIDIIFIFGFFTFAAYAVLMYFMFKSVYLSEAYRDELSHDLKLSIAVSSFVLILISSIAGHILFNGVVTFIWGVTIALPFWRRNNLELYASLANRKLVEN